MAKTAQEKADLKAEKLYEKTHKRKYRLKPGDIVFNILNYLFFTLFTIVAPAMPIAIMIRQIPKIGYSFPMILSIGRSVARK